jgi:copper(I)-binding protein
VAAIEIAANATVEFNADGPHIRLLGLTEPLEVSIFSVVTHVRADWPG